MAEPPENDTPTDEFPGIEEPPLDEENDTRPLKPMRDRSVQSSTPSVPDSPPAATVLSDAGIDLRRLRQAPPTTQEDTDRVRLVPKLPNPPAWRVIFQIGTPPVTVGLDVRQALIIGRVDAELDELPGLDLTNYDAMQNGVSRQHAVLIPSADALFVSDLGSTNGTWLNSGFLEPGARYILSAGDRLELGLLRLVVRTVTTVARSSG